MSELVLEKKPVRDVVNPQQMPVSPNEAYVGKPEDADEVHVLLGTEQGWTFSLHKKGYLRPKVMFTRESSKEEALEKGEMHTGMEYIIPQTVTVKKEGDD